MSYPKNYFEAICYKYISSQIDDEDMIYDAMCIALNSLTPRYYRDDRCLSRPSMRAYLEDMNHLAEQSSKIAIEFVKKNKRKPCI